MMKLKLRRGKKLPPPRIAVLIHDCKCAYTWTASEKKDQPITITCRTLCYAHSAQIHDVRQWKPGPIPLGESK